MFYYISVYIDIPDLSITLYYVILLDGDNHFCVSGHTSFAWHKSLPIPPIALYYCQKYSASLAAIFVHLFKIVFSINHHLLLNYLSYITTSRSLGVSRTLCIAPSPKSRGFGMGMEALALMQTGRGDRTQSFLPVFPHYPLLAGSELQF